jgi:hypothetical protein
LATQRRVRSRVLQTALLVFSSGLLSCLRLSSCIDKLIDNVNRAIQAEPVRLKANGVTEEEVPERIRLQWQRREQGARVARQGARHVLHQLADATRHDCTNNYDRSKHKTKCRCSRGSIAVFKLGRRFAGGRLPRCAATSSQSFSACASLEVARSRERCATIETQWRRSGGLSPKRNATHSAVNDRTRREARLEYR